jgi:hypothetical protein
MVRCSLSDDAPWESSAFSYDALPTRRPSVSPEAPTVFEAYLTPDVLKERRNERAACRESWAFVLSGAVQYATWLAYARLGLFFDNSHMSVEYLLSCYEEGPHAMCGCLSGDLALAFRAISERGEVTFRQFPFVASMSLSQNVFSRQEEELYCQYRSHLGTCGPCEGSEKKYVVTALAASADKGSFRYVVPCVPCQKAVEPKYFPTSPFRIVAPSPEELAACVRSELARFGPLPAALALDREAFGALKRGGVDLVVERTEQGVYYRPRHPEADLFHAVLIVGYGTAAGGSYWICRTSHGKGPFGYALAASGGIVRGLFNVDVAEAPDVLLDRVLSAEKMTITSGGEERRDLSSKDPFVYEKTAPTSPALISNATETVSSKDASRGPESHLRWWSLLLFLIFATAASALIIKWRSPNELISE